jgi:broad specificity phosphatase PhoE
MTKRIDTLWDPTKFYAITRLYLIRHGETVNTQGDAFRYNGHLDVDVSGLGEEQLKRVAECLKSRPLKGIYSSDLLRARKGAELIARHFPSDISREEFTDLREVKQGIWEGLTMKEVWEKYPDEARKKFDDYVFYSIPGGENLIEAQERAVSIIEKLVDRHTNEEFAVVAHGGINSLIICWVLGLDLHNVFRFRQDFGALNIVEFFEDGMSLRVLNNPCGEFPF